MGINKEIGGKRVMSDLTDEEIIATRRLHGLDDDLFEEEKEIEVREYVRTDKGYIFKIDKEKKNLQIVDFLDAEYGKMVKHSKQLIDLIENKDILKVKINKETIFLGIDENTSDIKYEELIKNIKNRDYELLEILTHQQFKANCYKVRGEEKCM